MFGHRGRGGPRRPTPGNVQCQRCLERGHYTYECKTTRQERPYTARPSRTQQLRNPKLMPKLTNDSLDSAERRKGLADAELAKREADRSKKREDEERDDNLIRKSGAGRSRSLSEDSVSTVSTNDSRHSPRGRRSLSRVSDQPPAVHDRPPSRRRSPVGSRRPGSRGRTPSLDRSRSRSYTRSLSRSLSRSRSRSRSRSHSRDRSHSRSRSRSRSFSRSPSRRSSPHRDRGREGVYSRSPSRDVSRSRSHGADGPAPIPPGRRSMSPRDSPPRQYRTRYEDEFPPRQGRGRGQGGFRGRGGGRGMDGDRFAREPEAGAGAARPPRDGDRERSLSPFSKRVALTKGMPAR